MRRGASDLRATAIERFFAKVTFDGDHWIWTGASTKGYGRFYDPFLGNCYAHRWAYLFWIEPLDRGMIVSHLCPITLCVNPDHLASEPGRARALSHPVTEGSVHVSGHGIS